jgi:hypothetical protein
MTAQEQAAFARQRQVRELLTLRDLGEIGWAGSYLKFNGTNLFNKRYLSSISTKPCFNPNLPTSSACGSYPNLTVGSPQTFQVTLRTEL